MVVYYVCKKYRQKVALQPSRKEKKDRHPHKTCVNCWKVKRPISEALLDVGVKKTIFYTMTLKCPFILLCATLQFSISAGFSFRKNVIFERNIRNIVTFYRDNYESRIFLLKNEKETGGSVENVDSIVDSYDPSVTGGCVRNLQNHLRLLDQSLKKSSGIGMFRWINDILAEEEGKDIQNITTAEQVDMNIRFGVLSHGTQSDPIFNYGNQASLILFEQTIESLCETPSRFSTVPEFMEDRGDLIRQIEAVGYGYIKDAIRVSAKGKLFLIQSILVWNVYDDNDDRIGLAAILDRNLASLFDNEGLYEKEKTSSE